MKTWPKNWPTIIDGIIEREVEGTVWLPVESCEFRCRVPETQARRRNRRPHARASNTRTHTPTPTLTSAVVVVVATADPPMPGAALVLVPGEEDGRKGSGRSQQVLEGA